jgi:transposase
MVAIKVSVVTTTHGIFCIYNVKGQLIYPISYLDGHLSIDNNRAERWIKPFVMGRKALMFSQTANGAKASAVLYSIV